MTDEMIEKPKPKMVSVKVIKQFDETVLIEFVDRSDIRRVVVPNKALDKGRVSVDDLAMGVVYGIDWSAVDIEVTAKSLSKALHEAGIFTKEDLLGNLNRARSVVQEIVPRIMRELINVARGDK